MGSASNAVLSAFFESNEEFETDESRQAFAANYLENLKFLYSNSKSAVSRLSSLFFDVCWRVYNQPYKSLFRGPLIIQTLAAHFSAVSGAVKISSIDPYASDKAPFGAIGLAAAAVLFYL